MNPRQKSTDSTKGCSQTLGTIREPTWAIGGTSTFQTDAWMAPLTNVILSSTFMAVDHHTAKAFIFQVKTMDSDRQLSKMTLLSSFQHPETCAGTLTTPTIGTT